MVVSFSTTATTLLAVLVVLMCLYFVTATLMIVLVVKLINSTRGVVAKAEDAIDSVESAAEVIKNAGGKLTFFKIISNIMDLSNKRSNK